MSSTAQERRALALEVASRVVPQGSPPGHFLSSARMFDRYLSSGLSRSAASGVERLVVGVEGVSIEVDGRFTPEQAGLVEASVLAAIEKAFA